MSLSHPTRFIARGGRVTGGEGCLGTQARLQGHQARVPQAPRPTSRCIPWNEGVSCNVIDASSNNGRTCTIRSSCSLREPVFVLFVQRAAPNVRVCCEPALQPADGMMMMIGRLEQSSMIQSHATDLRHARGEKKEGGVFARAPRCPRRGERCAGANASAHRRVGAFDASATPLFSFRAARFNPLLLLIQAARSCTTVDPLSRVVDGLYIAGLESSREKNRCRHH